MYFTPSHEWISLKENIGTVGITKFAQKELGEIVHVELPKVGTVVKAGEEVCVLESTKSAADIYAPVSGEIIAINENIRNAPSSINGAPEENSWLFQIKISDPNEIGSLMDLEKYTSLIS